MAQTLTRTFPDGDYPSRLIALLNAHAAAEKAEQRNPPQLLATENLPSEDLAAEYRALKAEAEADADAKDRVMILEALGRKKWRPLKEAHPPRVGDDFDEDTVKGDRLAGLNTETCVEDLLHRSLISPEKFACSRPPNDNKACTAGQSCSNRAAFDEWADNLSEGEFQTLSNDAWRLVNVAQFDPKSLPAPSTQNGATSGQ